MAFYGPGDGHWAMTERGGRAVRRDETTLTIGASALSWDGEALTIRIDEFTAPVPPMPTAPRPLRGLVRITPTAINTRAFSLDGSGRHIWRPIAPRADVQVSLDEPNLSWRGEGYLDTNAGVEPLEDAFVDWDWSRAHLRRDSIALYDLKRRDGSAMSLALRFDASGRVQEVEPPPLARLPHTLWRVPRTSRADAGHGVRVDRTWEDTPFYTRSAITMHLYGEPAHGVHESLSLDRFRSPLVRAILPFRMPRALR